MEKILLAVTGASGMLYLRSFLQVIQDVEIEVHGNLLTFRQKGSADGAADSPEDLPKVSRWFDHGDFAAAPASGSSEYTAMVVLPCSMGSLAAIAAGLSINLIHRAADVMLKERRNLVLAVRETPFNRTHLQNMLQAHDAGAVICPPMPSFYLQPANLDEMAATYSWRLADQLGIAITDRKRWGD